MKFYDRDKELAILQANEQQSFESAVFTVLMAQKNRQDFTHHKVFREKGVCLPLCLQRLGGSIVPKFPKRPGAADRTYHLW